MSVLLPNGLSYYAVEYIEPHMKIFEYLFNFKWYEITEKYFLNYLFYYIFG